MQQPTSTGWEAFSLQNFISAQLLRLVDSQAARKFVIYGGTPQEASTALLVCLPLILKLLCFEGKLTRVALGLYS